MRIRIVLLSTLILTSCSIFEDERPKEYSGGIALSFDDLDVNEWVWADSILAVYDWKATFFVSGLDKITDTQIKHLLDLQSAGHEIASHSMTHKNAVEYSNQYGIQKYLEEEVLPSLGLLRNKGFEVNSYAWPYGAYNDDLNSALLPHFDILRALAWGNKEPSAHYCYYDGNPVIYAFSMDSNYEYSTEEYILELMKYARDNDRIILLYGHKPVKEGPDGYNTKINRLEAICRFVEENNMRFYRLKELRQ